MFASTVTDFYFSFVRVACYLHILCLCKAKSSFESPAQPEVFFYTKSPEKVIWASMFGSTKVLPKQSSESAMPLRKNRSGIFFVA